MARRFTASENLDNDHAVAAAWTWWFVGVDDNLGGRILTFFDGEQLARACDVVGASATRQQAVVADAVEALWQHVDEEAADELVCSGRHQLLTAAALDPVILSPSASAA